MGTQTILNPTLVEQINEIVNSEKFNTDRIEAYKGNKSAIRRTRVALANIAKLAKAGRHELTGIKNNLPFTKE